MGLGKILKLGGIDNSSPKTEQSVGNFRVARNVYPTPDGRLIPRYDYEHVTDFPFTNPVIQNIIPYNGNSISFVAKYRSAIFDCNVGAYSNNEVIPVDLFAPGAFLPTVYPNYPQSQLFVRRNNTIYFLDPSLDYSVLFKYDGVELTRCGVDTPNFTSVSFTTSGTLKWVRIVQHGLDFDNNEPWSEMVQFSMLASDTSLDLKFNDPSGSIFDVITFPIPSNVSPSKPLVDRYGTHNWFKGSTTYNSATNDFTVICASDQTNILSSSQVGSYVFIYFTYNLAAAVTATTVPNVLSVSTGLDSKFNATEIIGLALKVKSIYISGSVFLNLDVNDSYGLTLERAWVKDVLDPSNTGGLTSLATLIKHGCKTFYSVWLSPNQNGEYYYSGFYPYYEALTAINITVPTTPSATTVFLGSDKTYPTLAPILNSIYDTTTTKISPNSVISADFNYRQFFGNWYFDFYCMTTYQDLLLLANDDLIWFSDTTLGGSFEQLNSFNFRKIGSSEYGRITAICGTNDFFVVCRERKNYYVNGNIATNNFRVQEMEEAELGAWSNASAIRVKDNVIILTATGIFSISDGARCIKLSDKVTKNFSTFDSNNINEDVSFKLTGTLSFPRTEAEYLEYRDSTILPDDSGICATYDEYRELLIFMQKKQDNPCLVIHTKTGEIYEWDGIYSSNTSIANCISSMDGNVYLGTVDNTVDYPFPITSTASVYKEDKTIPLLYAPSFPIKLYTTWLTAGEPSLEKLLLQLKMFGRVQSNGTQASLTVCHYKDWDISSKVTSSDYFPKDTANVLNNQVQYSHKKRLNSDKVLAASVGFEITDPNVTFELESIEIEMTNIQEGMKK